MPDGKSEKWSGTGAYEIHDQTAKGEADAIAERVVGRLSSAVDALRTYYVKKYGEAAADAAIGKADHVGLFKLAGGTTMTDGASAAVKEQEEIKALVAESVKQHLGDEWESMSPDEQDAAVRVWGSTCMRHLCNTFLDGGSAREKEWLTPLLAESLAAAPPHLRLSAEIDKLAHACAKGLGEGVKLYGKGEGAKNYRPYLEKYHGSKLHLKLERVDKGMRQDAKTQAALVLYYNRPQIVGFLKTALYSTSNVLRDNLYVMLSCKEVIATLRGRAIIHDKLTTRLRFFSASNSLNHFSNMDMAKVMSKFRDALDAIIADPSIALDESYDPFEGLDVPAYAAHLKELDAITARTVDGTTIHSTRAVRKEIYSPSDASNIAATDLTKQHLVAFATGMLKTFDNGQGARYVDDGEYRCESSARATPCSAD